MNYDGNVETKAAAIKVIMESCNQANKKMKKL